MTFKEIYLDFKKQQKIDREKVENEMLEYDKRYERFKNGDKTLKLSFPETLLWKILPRFFKFLIIPICIAAGILGGIYYLLVTLIISCIIGCLFIKIF